MKEASTFENGRFLCRRKAEFGRTKNKQSSLKWTILSESLGACRSSWQMGGRVGRANPEVFFAQGLGIAIQHGDFLG